MELFRNLKVRDFWTPFRSSSNYYIAKVHRSPSGRGDGGRECRYLERPFPYYLLGLFSSVLFLVGLCHQLQRSIVLSVLLARSLGPPRSEVLWDSLLCKRLWAFYDVRA